MQQSTRQPRELYILFFTEMWERFGYYTMRAIVVLYMIQFFKFSEHKSYAVFAAATALVYLTPLVGGHLADRLLGFRLAVITGGAFLSAGYFLLAVPEETFFYLGLGAIIIGNGFFKPNVSGIVGQLYGEKDPRREGGFNIFYAGINVGSLVPPIITAWIIHRFGWGAAFIMAGCGTIIGTTVFYLGLNRFKHLGCPPELEHTAMGRTFRHVVVIVLAVVGVGLSALLVRHSAIADALLFGLGGLFVVYSLSKSFREKNLARNRLLAAHLLIMFSVLFWALAQQAGMSLTMFTKYNVERHLAGVEVSTIAFQSVNPVFIILLGPVFAQFWLWLKKRGRDISIPAKFAWGTVVNGAGFVILPLAIGLADGGGKIGLSWIVLSYFLQTVGELLISPVGLTMCTVLSPQRMVGLMLGVWFFGSAAGNALAGFIADWTTLPSEATDPHLTDAVFSHVFGMLGWASVAAGLILLAATPWLSRVINPPKAGGPAPHKGHDNPSQA